eukprot:11205293-Lingulodinium_polyedra.AAC.1
MLLDSSIVCLGDARRAILQNKPSVVGHGSVVPPQGGVAGVRDGGRGASGCDMQGGGSDAEGIEGRHARAV